MAGFHPTHSGDIVHLNVGGTRYGRFNCVHFVSVFIVAYYRINGNDSVTSVWNDHIEPCLFMF
jgi:hypothetical protein